MVTAQSSTGGKKMTGVSGHTMALINMQSAEHSCSNSAALYVYWESDRVVQETQREKMGQGEHTVTHWEL